MRSDSTELPLQKLETLMRCLLQVERVKSSAQLYRENLLKFLSSLVKSSLQEQISGNPRAAEKAVTKPGAEDEALIDSLRQLDFADFSSLFEGVCDVVGQILVRISRLHEHVLALVLRLLSANDFKLPQSGTTADQLMLDLDEIVASMGDFAYLRVAKILATRNEQAARLTIKEFLHLVSLCNRFSESIEKISKRPGVTLKAALLSQAKSFLDVFHQRRTAQVTLLLDNEIWESALVPPEFQLLVDQLDASHLDVIAQFTGDLFPENANGISEDQRATMKEILVIDGRTFHVTNTLLMLIRVATEYIQLALQAQLLATDISHRLVDVLKLYNSRACQLILGAGAMQSAGLKSITARHLAISYQCLGAMIALVPRMKQIFLAVFPKKQGVFLADYDRFVRDSAEHQRELAAKFVAIMNDRIEKRTALIRVAQPSAIVMTIGLLTLFRLSSGKMPTKPPVRTCTLGL